MNKSVLSLVLAAALVSGLVLVSAVPVSSAQQGLVVIINSDTTWTKANSPINLTGPTVVNAGVTLTINAGVIVYQNGYSLYVNGTLRVVGSASDRIQIAGGSIIFGGPTQPLISSIENALINSSIGGNKPLVMSNDIIRNATTAGAMSSLTDNVIMGRVNLGDSSTIVRNKITGDIELGNFCILFNSTIVGDTTAGNSTTVTNNTITGGLFFSFVTGQFGYSTALNVGSGSVIWSNLISGGVSAASSTILNNVISGGGPYSDWIGRGEDNTSAVTVGGNSSMISNNTIFSTTGGYGILIRGYANVSGNTVRNGIRVASDALIENNLICNSGTGIQVGNIHGDEDIELQLGSGNSMIRSNTIVNNSVGIGSSDFGGTARIERNLISNNTYGIQVLSPVTVLNNTITNSSTAISLLFDGSAVITYNNIVNYTQYGLQLSWVSTGINATNNWWGSTNTQAVNLTIRDFKYDLSLGVVNFTPMLTLQNPLAFPVGATPNPPVIPEFTPLAYLTLLITTTLIVSIASIRKKANP